MPENTAFFKEASVFDPQHYRGLNYKALFSSLRRRGSKAEEAAHRAADHLGALLGKQNLADEIRRQRKVFSGLIAEIPSIEALKDGSAKEKALAGWWNRVSNSLQSLPQIVSNIIDIDIVPKQEVTALLDLAEKDPFSDIRSVLRDHIFGSLQPLRTPELPRHYRETKVSEARPLLRDMSRLLSAFIESLERVEQEGDNPALLVPNIPDPEVPEGADDSANVVVRVLDSAGKKKSLSHKPAVAKDDHMTAIEALQGAGFDRATRMSGSRFMMLNGVVAQLHRALGNWMMDWHLERGYEEYSVPHLVNWEAGVGSGQLPKFADDIYQLHDKDSRDGNASMVLISTSEMPLVNTWGESILDRKRLPVKMVAKTPCYRRESGSYGKDTRGLIRLHQFEKVELVRLVSADEGESERAFDEMVAEVGNLLEALKLPYRVVDLCAGDLGFAAARTQDLEVWLPSGEGRWCEISSISNCRDFQARRAMIRYRPKPGVKKTEYAHTLNGSGVAMGRCLAAVLENYWDGKKLRIPEVLQPYMGGLKYLKAD